MAASLFDVFGRLLLEDGGKKFVADSAKAGGAAGQTAGERFSAKAKLGFKLFAGVVATGLAAATTQGIALNEVLNQLQADTGATGDDWEHMQQVVRRENGRTTESLDEISDATRVMKQDLGLTGAELDKYADRVFDAGLATHTSAATIASATDDIGDGYEVNIDRALGSIDQLIISQQKWGGSLEERLRVLPQLAKGLRGLNGDIDDGVALLNAASASGISYEEVQRAINAAVGRFKVPPTLKEIIGLQDQHKTKTQLASDTVAALQKQMAEFVVPARLAEIVATLSKIEDPTLRAARAEQIYADEVAKFNADPMQRYLDILGAIPDAQARTTRAVELFGPKAGPVWATLAGQVAKAGGNLDSFNVTQEEAGDAATEVARKIDSGPVRSLKLLGERVGALLADAGSNPLVTGIASFGTILGGFAPNLAPKIATGLINAVKAGWGKVAASAVVSAAVGFASDKAATLYLKALMAGDAIAGALRGAWARVAGTAVVSAVIQRAGSAAATAYLSTLIAGDAIGAALKGAWARVAGAVAAQAAASGAAAGTAFAVAASAAIVAAPLAVLAVAIKIQGDIDRQGEEVKQQATDFVKTASDAELANAIAGVEKQLDGMVFNTFDSKNKVIAVLNELIAENNRRALGKQLAGKVADDLSAGVPEVGAAASKLGPAINDGLERGLAGIEQPVNTALGHVTSSIAQAGPNWMAVAHAQANRVAGEVAAGIREKRATVDTAWQALLDGLKGAMSVTAETAKLLGQLTSKELIRGLRSGDPAVRAQAAATKQAILDRLNELEPRAGTLSKAAMDELKKGMRSKDPDIRAASTRIYNAAISGPKKAAGATKGYGVSAAENYAAGLASRAAQAKVSAAARALAEITSDYLRGHSPTKLGPLSQAGGAGGWGELFATSFARGIAAKVAAVRAAVAGLAGAAAGGMPGALGLATAGAMAGAPSLGIPRASSGAVAPAPASKVFHITVPVTGLLRARDPLQVATTLRRFGELGLFERQEEPE